MALPDVVAGGCCERGIRIAVLMQLSLDGISASVRPSVDFPECVVQHILSVPHVDTFGRCWNPLHTYARAPFRRRCAQLPCVLVVLQGALGIEICRCANQATLLVLMCQAARPSVKPSKSLVKGLGCGELVWDVAACEKWESAVVASLIT